MEPDHLLAVSVGVAIGAFFGLCAAAVALGSGGSARRRLIAGALGFSLAAACGAAGCAAGFQIAWDLTRDVAWSGVGAVIGAVALALAGCGAPLVWLLRIR